MSKFVSFTLHQREYTDARVSLDSTGALVIDDDYESVWIDSDKRLKFARQLLEFVMMHEENALLPSQRG